MTDYERQFDEEDPKQIEERNNRKLTADKIRQILSKVENNAESSGKRWVWELVQNAKDIPNTRFGRVSIRITFSEDELVFQHNADPFKLKNIFSLIQQVSSKDSTNSDENVTGKFGTGFIATHILSGKIEVNGIVNHKGLNRKFSILLDREGNSSEELIPKINAALDNLQEIEDNHKFPIVPDYERTRAEYNFSQHTSFRYTLSSPEKKKAAKIGYEDLINTLPFTLVFNPAIKGVEVVNTITGSNEKYISEKTGSSNGVDFFQVTVERTTDREEKHYLVYKGRTNSTFDLAVQIDSPDSKVLIEDFGQQPNLYRDFPLIGSHKFYFPFIINGRKFLPTEDRDSILLHSSESADALSNREIIETAIESSLAFTDWLIAYGAKDLYVPAYTRLPDEKWQDSSRDWIKDLQKSWRNRLLGKDLLETPVGTLVPLKQGRFPLDGVKDERRELFYDLALPILGREGTCKKALLHDWIKTIDASEEKSWGMQLAFRLDDLLQEIQECDNLQILRQKFFQNSDPFTWLNKLYLYLQENEKSEKLSEYKIVPDETVRGEFHLLQDLYLEDPELAIPDHFLDILEELDLSWREKIINRKVKIPIQNLDRLSLSDASESINEILNKYDQGSHQFLFFERGNALQVLIKILQAKEGFGSHQEFKTQIFNFGKDLLKFNEDQIEIKGISRFNDNPALKHLIRFLNFTIQQSKDIDALAQKLGLDQTESVTWLNSLLESLEGREGFEKLYKNEFSVVPNRYGIISAYEDIYNFGTEEHPLDDELINILLQLDPNEDWKKFLPYPGIQIQFKDTKKFEELGIAVQEAVKKVRNDANENEISLEDYQDPLLDLINWAGKNRDEVRQYLASFEQGSKSLFFELTLKNSKVDIPTIKLLQKEENVSVLKAIDKSSVPARDLETLINIASEIGSVKELMEQAVQIKEEKKNFGFLLKIGTLAEKALKEALGQYFQIGQINHDGVGAFDITITNPQNRKSYFLELKSYSAESKEPFRFAKSQVEKVLKNEPNYAICFLPRASSNYPEINTQYIEENLIFRKQLKSEFSGSLEKFAALSGLMNDIEYPKLRIKLLEKLRLEMPQPKLFFQAGSFPKLISDIQQHLA